MKPYWSSIGLREELLASSWCDFGVSLYVKGIHPDLPLVVVAWGSGLGRDCPDISSLLSRRFTGRARLDLRARQDGLLEARRHVGHLRAVPPKARGFGWDESGWSPAATVRRWESMFLKARKDKPWKE